MYREFYNMDRLPFQLLPDPEFFYQSHKHDTALTHLEYGVSQRSGFMVITGDIGTGKTTLLRYLLRSLDEDLPVATISQTYLSAEELLRAFCQEFSLPHLHKVKPELLETIGYFLVEQYRRGKYVTLVLDEAQNLPLETLEEIRMLSNLDADNERILQIIFLGQPPLRTKLQSEALRQLYQRIEVSYHLEPLDRQEVGEYIRFRIETAGGPDPDMFDDEAIAAIFDYTGGVPRLINAVCHGCLVYGFADDQKKIGLELVNSVLTDREKSGLYAPSRIPGKQEMPQGFRDGHGGNTEVIASHNFLNAKLDHLIEMSGLSDNAIEGVADRVTHRRHQAELADLKENLTSEKRTREALEGRLARMEEQFTESDRRSAKRGGMVFRFPYLKEKKRLAVVMVLFISCVFSAVGAAVWYSLDNGLASIVLDAGPGQPDHVEVHDRVVEKEKTVPKKILLPGNPAPGMTARGGEGGKKTPGKLTSSLVQQSDSVNSDGEERSVAGRDASVAPPAPGDSHTNTDASEADTKTSERTTPEVTVAAIAPSEPTDGRLPGEGRVPQSTPKTKPAAAPEGGTVNASPAQETTGTIHDQGPNVYELAKVAVEKEEFARAMELLAGVMENESGDSVLRERLYSTALTGQALRLISQGQTPVAEKSLLRAVELNPSNFEAHFELGKLFTKAGEFPKAIDHYRHAKTLKPESASVSYNLGFVYAKTRDYPDAVAAFLGAADLNPPYADKVLFNLAVVQVRLGKKEDGIRSLKKSLALNPGNRRVKQYLEQLENPPGG